MWAKEMSEERMRNTGKNLVDFLINTSGVLTSSYYREKLPKYAKKKKGWDFNLVCSFKACF